MPVRVIILDDDLSHAGQIRQAVLLGYPELTVDQIEIMSYVAGVAYAKANESVEAVIRCYASLTYYMQDAASMYSRVQWFVPLGSNNFEEVVLLQDNLPGLIVTTGAGDFMLGSPDRNNTGFGKGLEFWDQDLIVSNTADESSYSTGVIAGKLLKIKDERGGSWWDARYAARVTAARQEYNRTTSPWDFRNGYGKISVDAAIDFNEDVPSDPYLLHTGAVQSEGLYVGITDLYALVNKPELDLITEVIDEASGESNIQRAIRNTCSYVDSKLGVRFDIPLTSEVVTSGLKDAIIRMVIWRLSNLYGSISDEQRQVREKMNDDAEKFIEDIAAGRVRLDSTGAGEMKNADKYLFDSNAVRMTRDIR